LTLPEVFYGNRIFDSIKVRQGFQLKDELLSEHGAVLEYYLIDNGNVFVSLKPAKTKNFSANEDFIMIDIIDKTKKLNKISVIKKHWKYFISYMKVTSLEGNPRIIDKFRVWKLRLLKTIYRDNKALEKKLYAALKTVFKFILTVGLSGFILVLLSTFQSNKSKDPIIEELKNIQKKQEEIINNFKNNKQSEIENRLSDINKNIIKLINKKPVN